MRWQSSGSLVWGRMALTTGGPKVIVGDEVAVHNVYVDDGAAAALGGGDLCGEVGEVQPRGWKRLVRS